MWVRPLWFSALRIILKNILARFVNAEFHIMFIIPYSIYKGSCQYYLVA